MATVFPQNSKGYQQVPYPKNSSHETIDLYDVEYFFDDFQEENQALLKERAQRRMTVLCRFSRCLCLTILLIFLLGTGTFMFSSDETIQTHFNMNKTEILSTIKDNSVASTFFSWYNDEYGEYEVEYENENMEESFYVEAKESGEELLDEEPGSSSPPKSTPPTPGSNVEDNDVSSKSTSILAQAENTDDVEAEDSKPEKEESTVVTETKDMSSTIVDNSDPEEVSPAPKAEPVLKVESEENHSEKQDETTTEAVDAAEAEVTATEDVVRTNIDNSDTQELNPSSKTEPVPKVELEETHSKKQDEATNEASGVEVAETKDPASANVNSADTPEAKSEPQGGHAVEEDEATSEASGAEVTETKDPASANVDSTDTPEASSESQEGLPKKQDEEMTEPIEDAKGSEGDKVGFEDSPAVVQVANSTPLNATESSP